MSSSSVATRSFSQMCRQLSRMSAVPYKQVLTHEVGRVIEKALDYTPAAKRPPIIEKWATAAFSAQPATLYTPQTAAGRAGRARARKVKGGKLLYFLFNRYPDALHAQIENRRLASLKRTLAAIGIAKKSWLQLAQQLGVAIKAPAFVRKAIARTGLEYPENTSVKVQESDKAIMITTTNAQPTVNLPTVGGYRAFVAAIAGREKFFSKNIKLRVFNDIARIARQYPGMKVNPAAWSSRAVSVSA